MRFTYSIMPLVLVVLGCRVHHPATQPAALLEPIELRYGIYLARIENTLTVSSIGHLRSVNTMGKSYGPGDIKPGSERIEVREGQLTAEQIRELQLLFAEWHTLSSEPYGAVADDAEVTLRYGEKSITGGLATLDGLPPLARQILDRLKAFAAAMPKS